MTPQYETPDRDRGSATLELVVLAPALLAVLTTILVAGRFEAAAGAVEQASAAAARAATLARTPTTAQAAARQAATAALHQNDLRCADLDVTIPTTTPVATTNREVVVTLTCTLAISEITVPGIPGTRQITSRTASVLDAYRSAS
jgi:Flp pilus assembly protein TadG